MVDAPRAAIAATTFLELGGPSCRGWRGGAVTRLAIPAGFRTCGRPLLERGNPGNQECKGVRVVVLLVFWVPE